MKTSGKISLALMILLCTLTLLAPSYYPFKAKSSAAPVDKPSAVKVVLGPPYNRITQAQPAAIQVATTQPTAAPVQSAAPQSTTKRAVSKPRSSGTKGVSSAPANNTNTDLYWLAKMVYAEAGAEPYSGQVAVADVILHRLASPNYPKTIKGVLFQVVDGHYQFTSVQNGYINQAEPNATAYRAAKEAMAGSDPSKGAMLYYNPKTSTNKWILSRAVTVVIGNHTFAK